MARILIVEDEALVAADMEDCLQAIGHQIVGVVDCAEEALRIVRAERPDLAILDVRIRGTVDGISLSAKIGVPFVFLTAHADAETLDRALGNAPYGYIVKPFRDQDLEASIQTALARVQNEAQLRRAKALLAATLGSLGEGVIACDDQLRVNYLNAVGAQMLKQPGDAAIGRPLQEVLSLDFDEEHWEDARTLASECLQSRQSVRMDEGVYLAPSAEALGPPLACCASPLLSEDDEPLGVVIVFRDRTPEAEALRQKVDFESRLLHAQRLESLGQIAGAMAHRFNNLLAGIMANICAGQAAPEEEGGAWLAEALELGERGATLCRQILSYSGRAPVTSNPLEVNSFIVGAVDLLTASIPKTARLTLQLEADASNLEIDAQQLQQLLTNLVVNAADALGGEHGNVVISTHLCRLSPRQLRQLARAHTTLGGVFLVIEVADTGSGMTPEVMRRAFDPFFSTRESGSGLGLAAVDGIVRAYGGGIDLSNNSVGGTVVSVYLPTTLDTARVSIRPAPVEERRPCILLVCDSPSIRSALTVIAAEMGFAVESAATLTAARRLLQERPQTFRVVLVDTSAEQMSNSDGLDEFRHAAQGLQIGVLSGYQKTFARRQFAQWGASFFIQKPFSRDTVLETLGSVLAVVSAEGA